jgi:Ca-activated chloride channel family protein
MYEAYRVTGQKRTTDPTRFYSVVLMTDGENNHGRDGGQFLNDFHQMSEDTQKIKAFTILFGEAKPSELQQLADASGGQVFDSRNSSLSPVFKEIRGYQ